VTETGRETFTKTKTRHLSKSFQNVKDDADMFVRKNIALAKLNTPILKTDLNLGYYTVAKSIVM